MAQSSFSALCIDYLPGMGTCTVMPLFTLCAGRTVFNLAFATRRRLNRLTADVVSYYAHVTDELPRWNTRLELQLVDSRLAFSLVCLGDQKTYHLINFLQCAVFCLGKAEKQPDGSEKA